MIACYSVAKDSVDAEAVLEEVESSVNIGAIVHEGFEFASVVGTVGLAQTDYDVVFVSVDVDWKAELKEEVKHNDYEQTYTVLEIVSHCKIRVLNEFHIINKEIHFIIDLHYLKIA